jgi:hypothetical protein
LVAAIGVAMCVERYQRIRRKYHVTTGIGNRRSILLETGGGGDDHGIQHKQEVIMADNKTKSEDVVPQADKQAGPYGYR